MPFIVTSQGRPIGTTDLGFIHSIGARRMGWFVPNALGETLIPRIATPLPAVRAHLLRDPTAGEPVRPGSLAGPYLADLAEHVQHVTALDLALQRDDGSPVSTKTIAFQDMEVLGEIGRRAFERMEAEEELESWQRDATFDPLEELDLSDDPDPLDEGPFTNIADDPADAMPWKPDDDVAPAHERYQIYVELVDGNDVPRRPS